MAALVNQGAFKSAADAVTHTCTFGFTATSGNLLIAVINSDNTFSTPTGYTQDDIRIANTQCGVYSKQLAGADTSLSCTLSASDSIECIFFEVSALATSSPFDATGSLSTATPTHPIATDSSIGPTAALSQAVNFAVAWWGMGGAGSTAATWSAVAGWTDATTGTTSGVVKPSGGTLLGQAACGYQITAATTALSAQVSCAGNTNAGDVMGIAVYKGAAVTAAGMVVDQVNPGLTWRRHYWNQRRRQPIQDLGTQPGPVPNVFYGYGSN